MKRFLSYFKDLKKECILGPLFKLLEASFDLCVPLVVKQIIDVGVATNDRDYIIAMGILLLILAVIGLTCSVTAQYFAAKAAVGFGTEMRSELFGHINKLSYAEIDSIGTSTLINRMTNDINTVQSNVNMVLRLFLRSPFIVIGAMVMAFSINGLVGIIFLLTIPILGVIVFGLMKKTMPMYKNVQKQLDQVVLSTRENLVGARVIRAFCRQNDESAEYGKETGQLKTMQDRVGRVSALMNPLTYVIINLATVGVIYLGGYQVNLGALTQGEVIALVNYMAQILVELIKLANLIVNVTKAWACAKRISDIMDIQPSVVEAHQFTVAKVPNAPKIEFQDVTFTYQNAKEPSVEHVSFVAEVGQTIGIIGSTGSGKSSLVQLIPRFYDATEGKVLIDGRDVKEYSFGQLRNKIGYVPQRAVLFKGSIRENMRWGKALASDQEIWNALTTAQAQTFVEAKKDQLDTKVLQGGMNLSGGQRQRLTIARALVKKPEILVLDDSASALDFATEAKLRNALRENTKNMTTFIVSQRAATIRYADQIIVLDDGAVAGIGNHDALFEKCEVYREICLSQLTNEEVAR